MTTPPAAGDAIAAMVGAIGTARFADRFHDALSAIGGVDLSSAFLHPRAGPARLLMAGGDHPTLPDFGLRASLAYARDHWRSDRDLGRAARSASPRPLVMRTPAERIADRKWRRECYDRASVAERLSIVRPGDPALVVNGYRLAGRKPFAPAEIAQLEAQAPVLLAALERDLSLRGDTRALPDEHVLTRSLTTPRFGLSVREAQVASAMMLGQTQEEIAARRHIARDTVVTYRQRAYGKLGIHDRRGLASLHRELIAGEPAGPS